MGADNNFIMASPTCCSPAQATVLFLCREYYLSRKTYIYA